MHTYCLQHWRNNGTKGVWLKLMLSHAALVPEAVRQGFGYHHAEPVSDCALFVCFLPCAMPMKKGLGVQDILLDFGHQDYLMLNMWLPQTPSPLPPNASHQVSTREFALFAWLRMAFPFAEHGLYEKFCPLDLQFPQSVSELLSAGRDRRICPKRTRRGSGGARTEWPSEGRWDLEDANGAGVGGGRHSRGSTARGARGDGVSASQPPDTSNPLKCRIGM